MLIQRAFFSYGRIALNSIINDIKKKNKKEKLTAYLPRYICSDVYLKFLENDIDIIYYELNNKLNALIDENDFAKIDIYYHVNFFGYVPLIHKNRFEKKYLIEDESQTIKLSDDTQLINQNHYIFSSLRKSICIKNTTIVYSTNIRNKMKMSLDISFFVKKTLKKIIPQNVISIISKNNENNFKFHPENKINYISYQIYKRINKKKILEKRKFYIQIIKKKLLQKNIDLIFNELNDKYIPSAIPVIIDEININSLNFISKYGLAYSRWAVDFPDNKGYLPNHLYKRICLIYLFKC